MAAAAPFAELCAKTNFSLLEGASRPEEMVEAAHAQGLFALAVADARGFYGSVRAHLAAQKLGQRYIVGAELAILPSSPSSTFAKVVFLVQNKNGYTSLCRLLTRAHADLPREEARISLDAIEAHGDDLFPILVTPTEDEMRRDRLSLEATEKAVAPLRDIFGERASLATCRLFSPDDKIREAWAKQMSARHGLALLA